MGDNVFDWPNLNNPDNSGQTEDQNPNYFTPQYTNPNAPGYAGSEGTSGGGGGGSGFDLGGLFKKILPFLGGGAGAAGASYANGMSKEAWDRVMAQINDYMGKYSGYQGMLQSKLGDNPALWGPQTTTSRGSTLTSNVSDTTPTITAEGKPLVNAQRNAWQGRIARGGQAPPGTAQLMAQDVNTSLQPQENALDNLAATRGVSPDTLKLGGPVARQRASLISRIGPDLQNQAYTREGQDLAGAGNFSATFDKGSHTASTGQSNTSGSTTSPANIQAILAYLQMLAPHEPIIVGQPPSQNPWLTGLSAGLNTYAATQKPPATNAYPPA